MPVIFTRRYVPRLPTRRGSCQETLQAAAIAARLDDFAHETASAAAKSEDLLLGRTGMAIEEMAEWLTAHAEDDLVAAADA